MKKTLALIIALVLCLGMIPFAQAEAIKLAKEFRASGKPTELVLKREDKKIEEYISCAKQNLCVSMMYLRNTNDIEMVNLLTGTGKSVSKTIK